jgi:3'(2'), 5'-bisphosphate nucleotidase
MEWDIAAAQAVLECAGGHLTDLDGQPLRYNARASLVNPHFIAYGDASRDWLRYVPR